MVHVGLNLSRTRLDVQVMDESGTPLTMTTAVPDAGGLATLAHQIAGFRGPVYAAIESINCARFRADQLALAGWQVEIANAQKVKGLAPLACKTDKIDSWVLAELSRRDLVPAIWLPTPSGACRAEAGPVAVAPGPPPDRAEEPNPRHPARVRPPMPGVGSIRAGGRALLARLALPEPWAGRAASNRRARPRGGRVRA
ncbi:MAG TPA: transposase [Dehalococcoidia bacterium]|nr:transposase [Dehalococcoidia bacterium]